MKGSARAKARRGAWVASIGYDPMRLQPGEAPPPPPNQAQAPASKDRRAAWLASIGAAPPKSTADFRKEQVAAQVQKAEAAPLQIESEEIVVTDVGISHLDFVEPEIVDDELPEDDDDLLLLDGDDRLLVGEAGRESSVAPVLDPPKVDPEPKSAPSDVEPKSKKKRVNKRSS
jgi:hypothetical protein